MKVQTISSEIVNSEGLEYPVVI